MSHHLISLLLLWNVFLELVLGAFFSLGQIFKQPDDIRLEQTKPFSATDRDLFFFNILQLIDSVTNVNPAPSTGVLDDRIFWIFLRSHLVNRLTVTLKNLAFVLATSPFLEHGGMSSQ